MRYIIKHEQLNGLVDAAIAAGKEPENKDKALILEGWIKTCRRRKIEPWATFVGGTVASTDPRKHVRYEDIPE